jgi:hypothetical protein
MNDKGRKITVTMVKMVMALLFDSFRTSIIDRSFLGMVSIQEICEQNEATHKH